MEITVRYHLKNQIKSISPCSRFYVTAAQLLKWRKKIIANNCSYFFINMGPILAKKIPSTSRLPTSLITRNINNMVVLPVNQSDIVDIIIVFSTAVLRDAISANVVNQIIKSSSPNLLAFYKPQRQNEGP